MDAFLFSLRSEPTDRFVCSVFFWVAQHVGVVEEIIVDFAKGHTVSHPLLARQRDSDKPGRTRGNCITDQFVLSLRLLGNSITLSDLFWYLWILEKVKSSKFSSLAKAGLHNRLVCGF